MKNYAYFTLLSSDDYINGIRILAESFLRSNSPYPLNIMVTDNCSIKTFFLLDKYFKKNKNIIIRKIKPVNFTFVSIVNFECYVTTLNKFQMLNYKEYDKVMFLDADVVVLKNIDYLFDMNDKIYTNFCYFEDRGVINVLTGDRIDLSKELDKKTLDFIKSKYNGYTPREGFLSWGGCFVMNTHLYDFKKIVKEYQNEGINTDEYILDTIIYKDEELKETLSKEDNEFITIVPSGDDGYSHKTLLHRKFWSYPDMILCDDDLFEKFLLIFKQEKWKEELLGLCYFCYEEVIPKNEHYRFSEMMQDYLIEFITKFYEWNEKMSVESIVRLLNGNCLDDEHIKKIRKVLKFE